MGALLLLSPQEAPASVRGDFRVAAMASGPAGQLVPAQAAQNKAGMCRERQNLAVYPGLVVFSWKANPGCTALPVLGLPHIASPAAAAVSC